MHCFTPLHQSFRHIYKISAFLVSEKEECNVKNKIKQITTKSTLIDSTGYPFVREFRTGGANSKMANFIILFFRSELSSQQVIKFH